MRDMVSMSLDVPGMSFMFELDRLFRKAVHSLQTEANKRKIFRDYVTAHNYVMAEHKHIWSEARDYARNKPNAPLTTSSSALFFNEHAGEENSSFSKKKKQRSPEEQHRAAQTRAENEANRERNLKRKAEAAEQRAQAEAAKRAKQGNDGHQGSGRRGGKGSGKGSMDNKSQSERIDAMKARRATPHTEGTCLFFNVGACKSGEQCRYKHRCWLCGGQHTWMERHA